MEILHQEVTNNAMPIGVLVVLLIIFLIILFTVVWSDGLLSFLMLVLIGSVIVAFFTSQDTPNDVLYKVKVTDWNEVYDGGYEVIDAEGEIVTLKKSVEEE